MIRALFFVELRRLRGLVRFAMVAHGLLLAALAYAGELVVPTRARQIEASVLVVLAGLLLGLHQVGSYRRRELWSFLLHRPAAPASIFAALAGAAFAALAVALALPLALAGAGAALAGLAGGVWPHLVAPYALGLALAAYFAGALLALRPWPGSVLAGVLTVSPVVLLVVPAPIGAWIFAPLFAVVVALGALARAAFRADLHAPLRGRWTAAAAVAPALYLTFLALSFALLLAYSLGVAFVEKGWRGPALHAWNDYFPRGTFDRAVYLSGHDTLAHGLEASGPEARALVARLEGAETVQLRREPGRPLAERRDSVGSLASFDLLLADDALLVLAPGALSRPDGLAAPRARLPLAEPHANLESVAVAALDDGLVVSFLEGRRSERGFAPARQTVWRVSRDGGVKLLAERALAQGAPLWVRHRGLLLSPALQAADDLLRSSLYGAGRRTATWSERLAAPPPAAIRAGAFIVALLSAAATFLLARRRGLDAAARRRWTVAALLLGAPVPFVLPHFVPRRD